MSVSALAWAGADLGSSVAVVYSERARGLTASSDGAGRVREGVMDEAGLAEIYQRCSPAIYAHCRRLLGSAAAARDATHEAFVRVMARGPKLLTGDDALRYLYRVATNVCLNQIREQRVHDRATPALVARSASLGRGEAGHADRQFVIALLDRCDETGSSIAVMHYVDGMSQVEIAETLGITRRTVFNRLRKLEKLARELLGRSADDDATENTTSNDGSPARADDAGATRSELQQTTTRKGIAGTVAGKGAGS